MTGIVDVSEAAPALQPVLPSMSRARVWAFYIVLGAALLLVAVPMAPFLIIPIAWPFLAEELGVHQLHDVGVATMLWFMVVGLVAQVRGAERRVGAMQQLLLVAVMMVGMTAIGRPATLLSPNPLLLAMALIIACAALHPARAEVARVKLRLDPVLAALALLAAGPLLVFARGQVRLDHSALPIAVHGGHWTAMATVAVLILALSLLGATRPRGWRVPVWSAGGAALLVGTASAALPHMPSSPGPVWGVIAALWGITFVVTAEMRFRR